MLAIFVLSSFVCLEGRLGRARWIGDGLLLREKEVSGICREIVDIPMMSNEKEVLMDRIIDSPEIGQLPRGGLSPGSLWAYLYSR